MSTPRNFDEVLGGIAPAVQFRVENHLSDEGGQFGVQLQFREMADFRPEAVVQQVAPLKGLLDARTKLADLRNKLAGNDKLDDILSDVLGNTEKLAGLRKQRRGQMKWRQSSNRRRTVRRPHWSWTIRCSTRSSNKAAWPPPAASMNARAT